MEELGAPTVPLPVADAVVEGFASTLDLQWSERVTSTARRG
jgi:hypothetical protein